MSAQVSATVAVLTYRRPTDLQELLPLLVAELDAVAVQGSVLVVDNDPGASAGATVAALHEPRVRYVHEPVPGIAAARNRALDEARGELVIFIDDDERPVPGWLGRLLQAWSEHRPAAVVGPVVSEFAGRPSDWVAAGRFFSRRRMPSGTEVSVAATNNLLLELATVRAAGLRFDERFGLTGGSDYLFTRQLHMAGARLVWCDEAVVVDRVPLERITRRWVLQRAFRTGNSPSYLDVMLAPPGLPRASVRAAHLGRGVLRVVGGGVKWCTGAATGSLALRAGGARNMARGVGLALGAVGYLYGEYRRSPAPAPRPTASIAA